MAGFTQEYFTPFLLLLGATIRQIGLLASLPNLCASLIQIKSADITENLKSRRKIINIFVFIQALMLLPAALIAFLGKAHTYIFIIIAILFASCAAIAVPAWSSLMSDLVEPDKRGAYFGWRSRTLGLIGAAATFIAGITLHHMKKVNVYYGFAIIFSSAFIFRMISWYFLTRMHEPHLEHKRENYFSIFEFLGRVRESNFTRFVLLAALMNFSVNLVSPFFVVLMLKNLHFSYLTFTLITITATLTSLLVIGRWGSHADRIGNFKVIKFTAYFIACIPLLWIVNRNPVFLFFVQGFSGFAWAGFNLCTSNFIYDSVTPEKRTRCISYFNVINGAALSSGALLGGLLFQILPPLLGYRILTLCIISAIFRFLAAYLMSKRVKEVRHVDKVSTNQLFFSVIGMKPMYT